MQVTGLTMLALYYWMQRVKLNTTIILCSAPPAVITSVISYFFLVPSLGADTKAFLDTALPSFLFALAFGNLLSSQKFGSGKYIKFQRLTNSIKWEYALFGILGGLLLSLGSGGLGMATSACSTFALSLSFAGIMVYMLSILHYKISPLIATVSVHMVCLPPSFLVSLACVSDQSCALCGVLVRCC